MAENGEIHQILGCPSKFSDRLMCVTWGVRGCVADVEGWVLETKSLWISAGDFLTSSEIWENKIILDFNFQKIHENTRNTTTYVWLCLVHLKVIPYFRLELVAFFSGSGVWTPKTGRPLRSGNKRTGWTGRMAPAGRSPSWELTMAPWLSETTASPWKLHQSRWRHLANGWDAVYSWRCHIWEQIHCSPGVWWGDMKIHFGIAQISRV